MLLSPNIFSIFVYYTSGKSSIICIYIPWCNNISVSTKDSSILFSSMLLMTFRTAHIFWTFWWQFYKSMTLIASNKYFFVMYLMNVTLVAAQQQPRLSPLSCRRHLIKINLNMLFAVPLFDLVDARKETSDWIAVCDRKQWISLK